MLTTSKEMMRQAYAGGYAVPAVNTQGGTYDIIRAICMAAEEERSPVILAHYVSTGAYSGHDCAGGDPFRSRRQLCALYGDAQDRFYLHHV